MCVCVYVCVCLNVFSPEYGIREHSKNPQLREADADAFFLSWRVSSFEQPRAVFVQGQEVLGFMSQGKFHFVPDVAYAIEHHARVEDCKRTFIERSIMSVSWIVREDL